MPSSCIVWQCPRCLAYRWIDKWEGYDEVTACPECDAVLEYAEVLGQTTQRLCRAELMAAADLEAAPKRAKERMLFA